MRNAELVYLRKQPIILAILFAQLSCGGGDVTAPATGSIEITTATSGPDPDGDGYSVTIDAGNEETIGVNASLRRDNVEPGSHTIQLRGAAANCTVADDNPRGVTIRAGQTTSVSFVITCKAMIGSLRVTSSTNGASPDIDGYRVIVDGADRGVLTTNGELVLEGLVSGPHVIGLSGLAANCHVDGENPRMVSVSAGETATAGFVIVCITPPSSTGMLRVTTATSGGDLDPDGYSFSLDGTAGQTIGTNTTVMISNVSAGSHLVQLLGVAAHCTLEGPNPKAVTVPKEGIGEMTFTITCQATTGTIEVTTSTTGSDTDADGYTFALDGGAPQSIESNATVVLGSLVPGAHAVELSDVAANCVVQGTNPRTVTVLGGARATVIFALACTATTGTVDVRVASSGEPVDADGYLIKLDGVGAGLRLTATGTASFTKVTAGSHTILLTELADNCVVQRENPQTVSVPGGSTAQVSFAVDCTARPNGPGSWTVVAPIPTFRYGIAQAVVQSSSGEYLFYTIGGGTSEQQAMQQVEVYNAATDRWTRKSNLPTKRYGATAAVLAEKIYVFGGTDANRVPTSTVYVYDPLADAWTEKANSPVALPIRNISGISGVINGQLYILMGSPIANTQRLYRYDPSRDEWTRLADPINDHLSGVGGVINGRLYVAWGRSTRGPSATVDIYDPTTDLWSTDWTQVCVPDADCSISGAAGVVLHEQLYVIGGLNDDEAMSSTNVYDPVAKTWTLKAFMHFQRESGPVAGKLRNAAGEVRLIVVGGYDGEQGEDAIQTEIYMP